MSKPLIERWIREGILTSWEEPVDPADDPFDVGYEPPAHTLNPAQESAFGAIRARFELGVFGVQLLHGVTGSGKTEVYLRAVQDTLARGKTAIVLVPEIALTLWMGRQCRAWFGAQFEGVVVLHSALSDVERSRAWWRVRHGEARVVVGTRSAVFAPLENVGLIIVDEEQESSYKQEETPRYHGATSRLSARNRRMPSRCSARRHLRSKRIITHGKGSTSCLRLQRVLPRARCHPLRSSACAMNFNRRTKPVPSHRRCMWESSNALATERRR